MTAGRWVLVVVALALLPGIAVAAGNEPPMVEAGLDQTVTNGTTVYLDAGGSADPDGSIADVTWTITRADGTPVDATCLDCVQPQFTPNRTERYTATVTVTDDDGTTRTDTLYVTVEEPGGPTVDLSGPDQTVQGAETSFVVAASAGEAALDEISWLRNGSQEAAFDADGETTTVNRTFDEPGTYRLRATAHDVLGYTESDARTIQVLSGGGGGGGGGTYNHCPGDQGSPYFGPDGHFIGCQNGADMTYGINGETYVLNSNDKDGIWLHQGDELVQMVTKEEYEEMKTGPGAITRSEVHDNYEDRLETDPEPKTDSSASDGYEDDYTNTDNTDSEGRSYDDDADPDGSGCNSPSLSNSWACTPP